MNTPIFDYVQAYLKSGDTRLHMPGHKGKPFLGCEAEDITEIPGADCLYTASGIIKESEENTAALFGSAATLYSTEGSSLCIRTMLYLAVTAAKSTGVRPVVIAARNAHKVFIQTAALLDFDVIWLWPNSNNYSLCSAPITLEQVEQAIKNAPCKPAAVYITSPDYLGGCADISGLARVAHGSGIPLIVDNAHGAYLKFMQKDVHPLSQGADMCCDSAHKTLPALTGGAYLHISQKAPKYFCDFAKNAMSLFGSTSPSYLILQSLDLTNRYLAEDYEQKLKDCIKKVNQLKQELSGFGLKVLESDPLKLTVQPKAFGYTGEHLADYLGQYHIICEYADPDYVVMMFTPENSERDYIRVLQAFTELPQQNPIMPTTLHFDKPEVACSPRRALFSAQKTVCVENAVGKVLADCTVSCPPAIPVLVSGEVISAEAIPIFEYYGINKVHIIAEESLKG